MRRAYAPELIDAEGHDRALLAHSLGQVAGVNRWLGGIRSLLLALRELHAEGARTLLDVGTGNAATLSEVLGRAERDGCRYRGWGLDRSREALAVANGPARPPLVQGDGLALPFRDGAVDVVTSTLTLHHFREPEARALLAEMARVAARAVVVSDLERSRLHWLGARVLAATVWRRNRLTRHDGPLSVRRSFTAAELAGLGRAAGLGGVEVRRHLPWRLVLVGRP